MVGARVTLIPSVLRYGAPAANLIMAKAGK